MSDGYELGTAETLEDVMERRTDVFDSLKTEQLTTQWSYKISSIPESEGITEKWWSPSSGVVRDGPEAEIPGGEQIATDSSGEYIVGTPALAGGAGRIEGQAQDGNDDWWMGFSDRLTSTDASSNGAGIGYTYFSAGEGDNGGAAEDGDQEYIWFHSDNANVPDQKIPRDQWNGDDLSGMDVDLSKGNLFHRGGFVRIDHTFYNHGAVDVNWGVKGGNDGDLHVKTLHSFTIENEPMWSKSDLNWESATNGTNVTGYVNAAHYKAGEAITYKRFNGTGRDGTVLGSALGEITQGVAVPLISIKLRSGWEDISLKPADYSVVMDSSFYLFIATNTTLDGTEQFEAPNSELSEYTPDGSEYGVLADNDAEGLSDIGDIEVMSFISSANKKTTEAEGTVPNLGLSSGDTATIGVIPVDATSFTGADLQWVSNF